MFCKNDCSVIRRGDDAAKHYDDFRHNIQTNALMVDEEGEVIFALPGEGTITDGQMYTVLGIVSKYYNKGVEWGEYRKAAEIRKALGASEA